MICLAAKSVSKLPGSVLNYFSGLVLPRDCFPLDEMESFKIVGMCAGREYGWVEFFLPVMQGWVRGERQ